MAVGGGMVGEAVGCAVAVGKATGAAVTAWGLSAVGGGVGLLSTCGLVDVAEGR